ncbi:hypothetical protein Hypma_007077 [Hypsizygus marmoreus]|uniref:Uncharacterized protein n=1 Tax=Hypsizygus marmoreus TaxID=39966 RepID=A0A369KBS6_HYPMA|nr:hypothetical protein Hypma_007077 [Hypsizygus marmoreus]
MTSFSQPLTSLIHWQNPFINGQILTHIALNAHVRQPVRPMTHATVNRAYRSIALVNLPLECQMAPEAVLERGHKHLTQLDTVSMMEANDLI